MSGIRVQGWDLALNHAGFVELTDGELTNFWYVTDHKGAVAKGKGRAEHIPLPKTRDKHEKQIVRLAFFRRYIHRLLATSRPHYVGVEDYAMDMGTMAHLKGELGGIARDALAAHGIPFRLHDPGSIKMFTAYNGTASKEEMVEAVEARWAPGFGRFNPSPKNTVIEEDLCDAMAVAKLVWTEVQLRAGEITLKDLEHPKEIQVFNRVTKAHPENLLARDWLMLPEEMREVRTKAL